jgi:hypothetical protein
MDVNKAKRYVAFLYWIPAIVIIGFRVPMSHYLFLALPIPYLIATYLIMQKIPYEERNQVDYARIVLIGITHFVLYYLMYWG